MPGQCIFSTAHLKPASAHWRWLCAWPGLERHACMCLECTIFLQAPFKAENALKGGISVTCG